MDEVELRQSTSGSLHAAEFLPPHEIVGRSRFRPLIPVRLLSLGARLAAVSSNEDKRRAQVTFWSSSPSLSLMFNLAVAPARRCVGLLRMG